MLNIFQTSSKYIIIILFAFYTYYSFNTLRNTSDKYKKKLYRSQNIIMYLIHTVSYAVILLNMQENMDTVILFYGSQLVYFILVIGLSDLFFDNKISRSLLNNMCMLLCISFIILSRLSFTKSVKQFQILVVATIAFFIIIFLYNKIKFWPKLILFYGMAGILILLLVLVFAQTSYGAKLSLDFKYFTIQPLEFVKIIYVFFLSSLFLKSIEIKYVVKSALIAGIHVILLVFSRDLGSALILFLVYLFMLYVATKKSFYLFGGLIAGSAASWIAYKIFYHVRVRVVAWIDPWTVIDKEGYQITQSLFAIGTGGWLGLGLFQGKPNDIPVVEQDFIFSAISEEFGGFFAICLILLYLSCFMNFIKISMEQGDIFNKMIVFGLGVTFGVQIFFTIGGAIKLIPSTGVTLPLISYGGSSLFSTIIIFAIIQAIVKNNNEKQIVENGAK